MNTPWVKWGLIGALLSFAFSAIVVLVFGVGQSASGIQYLGMIIPVFALYMAVSETKKATPGDFGFGDAFKPGAFTTLIMAGAGILFTFVLFSFIAPSNYQDLIMNEAREGWEKAGMTEEAMEQAEGMTKTMTSPTVMGIIGAIFNVIIGMILAAIMAAVLKKPAQD